MAETKPGQAPVIIKKVKKSAGHAHHGGAWKVAYADFVTAMMAFFLLMWLLNATTEEQRKGLADYFNPSIPISKVSGGGSGALNGSSVLSEDTLIQDGVGATADLPKTHLKNEGENDEPRDAEDLRDLETEINDATLDVVENDLARHVQTRMTPDGLVVELVDADGDPLFNLGSPAPSALLGELLFVIAPILATVENKMAIVGHTDARAYSGDGRYSNWELSTDRAHAARRLLIANGVSFDQIAEVTGKADTEPVSPDPFAAQNRRIAVTLLSHQTRTDPSSD
ncbi:MAG: flagellar motor protein MotB [Pseudomonadota bacterium]